MVVVRFADSVTARRSRRPYFAHNGNVRRSRIRRGRVVVTHVLVFCAVTLAVIALAPVIVLVGEPLRRYCLRRLGRQPWRLRAGWRGHVLARAVVANPILITLTAPGRWAIDQVGGRRAVGPRGRGFRPTGDTAR